MSEIRTVAAISTNAHHAGGTPGRGVLVPIFQRFMLTPKEASLYFHIGEKKIKAIAAEHPDASFVVYNGSHLLIVRGEFEKFLCNTSSI